MSQINNQNEQKEIISKSENVLSMNQIMKRKCKLKMKTCPTCPKKRTSATKQESTSSDVRSTKVTSIITSPIVKSSRKTTI